MKKKWNEYKVRQYKYDKAVDVYYEAVNEYDEAFRVYIEEVHVRDKACIEYIKAHDKIEKERRSR